jgi:hypothetical protein
MSAAIMRATVAVIVLALSGLLGACGGGGASGGGGSSPGSNPPPIAGAAANVAPVIVDAGPAAVAGIINTAYVSVSLCVPGTTQCQTVDHVSVDTGSSGLRILASALKAPAAFPARADASGNALAECMQFADGYSWGPVRVADIKLSGETAGSQSVQIIGDAGFSTEPSGCTALGVPENTVAAFGANGVLGVGVFAQDCGSACVAAPSKPALYYSCPSSASCQGVAVALAQQVQNPVGHFSADNNGIILELPAIGAAGAATVTGALVFGIDTQSNNQLGNATVLKVDAVTGFFTTIFNGVSSSLGLFDSGSSAIFFADGSTPTCPTNSVASGYYCPASVQSLSATVQGTGTGVTGTVSFSVANAVAVLGNNTTFYAFKNIGAPNPLGSSYFTWGLPFFFAHDVFVAIEGQSTSSGPGPFEAYE